MAGEFTPENLEKTRLWQRLSAPFADEATTKLAKSLAQSLLAVCNIAADRMKFMPAVHGEFTLHDDTHLLRVTELMAKVLPNFVLEKVLNPVEIALLVLAAHFHDVGMIPDNEEEKQLRSSDAYKVARENWLLEYSGFNEASRISADEDAEPQDKSRARAVVNDFESTAFTRFLRDSHAKRSADFVKNRLGTDARLRVGTGHLADSLSLLCESHNWPPDQIIDGNGFYYDKAIGTYPVNLAYLAMTLRLADSAHGLLASFPWRVKLKLHTTGSATGSFCRQLSFSGVVCSNAHHSGSSVSRWSAGRCLQKSTCPI